MVKVDGDRHSQKVAICKGPWYSIHRSCAIYFAGGIFLAVAKVFLVFAHLYEGSTFAYLFVILLTKGDDGKIHNKKEKHQFSLLQPYLPLIQPMTNPLANPVYVTF